MAIGLPAMAYGDGIIARFYENLDRELAALCGGEKTEY